MRLHLCQCISYVVSFPRLQLRGNKHSIFMSITLHLPYPYYSLSLSLFSWWFMCVRDIRLLGKTNFVYIWIFCFLMKPSYWTLFFTVFKKDFTETSFTICSKTLTIRQIQFICGFSWPIKDVIKLFSIIIFLQANIDWLNLGKLCQYSSMFLFCVVLFTSQNLKQGLNKVPIKYFPQKLSFYQMGNIFNQTFQEAKREPKENVNGCCSRVVVVNSEKLTR